LTQTQAAELPEDCVDPLEKLALLKDLNSKKRKSALLEPLNNSLVKRVKVYTTIKVQLIPKSLLLCDENQLTYEEKEKTNYRHIVNYLDLELNEDIHLTKLKFISKIKDFPKIEYKPDRDLYQDVPTENSYNAVVGCIHFLYSSILYICRDNLYCYTYSLFSVMIIFNFAYFRSEHIWINRSLFSISLLQENIKF
jgi:hypothetical protein